LLSIGCFQEQI